MLTRRTLALARLRGLLPRTARGWALSALAVLYAAAVLVAFFSADVGAGVVLAVNAGALIVVSPFGVRGFLTLAGRLRWHQYGPWARVGLACLYLAGWLVPPVWLWLTASDAMRARRAEVAARPARIAEMERALGLDRPRADTPDTTPA
jgi:hypothetical protein